MPRKLPKPTPRMRRGAYGQRLARAYLEGLGFRIVEENYRCRWGELDIVALDGDCLVFVEVRSRTGNAFGTPEESIVPAKARRLALLAQAYRAERGSAGLPDEERIDVVGVDLDPAGGPPVLRLVRNAIEAS